MRLFCGINPSFLCTMHVSRIHRSLGVLLERGSQYECCPICKHQQTTVFKDDIKLTCHATSDAGECHHHDCWCTAASSCENKGFRKTRQTKAVAEKWTKEGPIKEQALWPQNVHLPKDSYLWVAEEPLGDMPALWKKWPH